MRNSTRALSSSCKTVHWKIFSYLDWIMDYSVRTHSVARCLHQISMTVLSCEYYSLGQLIYTHERNIRATYQHTSSTSWMKLNFFPHIFPDFRNHLHLLRLKNQHTVYCFCLSTMCILSPFLYILNTLTYIQRMYTCTHTIDYERSQSTGLVNIGNTGRTLIKWSFFFSVF